MTIYGVPVSADDWFLFRTYRPEFTAEITGVRRQLIGLRADGAIAVISLSDEAAGRKIENIYDYTYALNALKVDRQGKDTGGAGRPPGGVSGNPHVQRE